MKDRIAKQAYDKGYDAGVADKAGGYARLHTESNPYKKTHSLRTYTRYDYWLMGYDDGYTGHVRRMSQEEADLVKADRMARLEEIVQVIADGNILIADDEFGLNCRGCSWSSVDYNATPVHDESCLVTKANALMGDSRQATAEGEGA